MTAVLATDFVKNFGKYSEEAQREPIAITSYGRVSGYYMSAVEHREYERVRSKMRPPKVSRLFLPASSRP